MIEPGELTPLQKAKRELEEQPAQTRVEVVKGVTVRRKKKGLTVMSIHYSAIPERDPDNDKGKKWKEGERKKYSSEARWKKEQEIDPYATGGEAVFGQILSEFYDVVVISDPLWHPDPRWDVVGGFDSGIANATSLLKAYVPREQIDPKTGRTLPTEIILAGEYYSYRREGWENNVDQNVEMMVRGCNNEHGEMMGPMPDMNRARWISADPSIFWNKLEQAQGAATNIYVTYKKNAMFPMRPYDGIRSDVTFVQWMLSDYWRGIAHGRKPRLRIVCRNPAAQPQPGLHPYDCPNLLWELKRARRVEMTSRQLQTQSQKENLQDKDNHLRDCMKYITGLLRNPTAIPAEEYLEEQTKDLDAFTGRLRSRFLMSELAMQGKVGLDGKPRKGKPAPIVDLRRAPSVGGRR